MVRSPDIWGGGGEGLGFRVYGGVSWFGLGFPCFGFWVSALHFGAFRRGRGASGWKGAPQRFLPRRWLRTALAGLNVNEIRVL